MKSRIQKYFVKNKTKRWIDILQNVVDDYNKTPHSAHGFPPQDVDSENREIVYKKLYPNFNLRTVCKLSVGDKVRKILQKDIFEKGYQANWSEEIYIISKVKQSDGVCWYYLEDLEGTKQKGNIYLVEIFINISRHLVLLSIKPCCKTC